MSFMSMEVHYVKKQIDRMKKINNFRRPNETVKGDKVAKVAIVSARYKKDKLKNVDKVVLVLPGVVVIRAIFNKKLLNRKVKITISGNEVSAKIVKLTIKEKPGGTPKSMRKMEKHNRTLNNAARILDANNQLDEDIQDYGVQQILRQIKSKDGLGQIALRKKFERDVLQGYRKLAKIERRIKQKEQSLKKAEKYLNKKSVAATA